MKVTCHSSGLWKRRCGVDDQARDGQMQRIGSPILHVSQHIICPVPVSIGWGGDPAQ